MILGRSLTLWTGAVAAVLNAVVLANIVVLTGDQVAALNGAVFAVLALLATSDTLSVAKGNRVIAIAHRRELIYQLAERLTLHGVTDIGIIMAGEKPSNAAVQVCSIQTLIRRKLPEAQLILVDEVHHARFSRSRVTV